MADSVGRLVSGVTTPLQTIMANFGLANFGLLTLILGMIMIALLATRKQSSVSTNLVQRSAPIAPLVQPKSVKTVLPAKIVPQITKVIPTPVLNTKSVVPVMPPKPKTEAPKLPAATPVENTFEAYRQAMLSSGPRQMEEEARAELQSKGASSASWREQTASLRSTLRDESAASFLERTNTSINDRMVAIFDAVKA